MTEKIRNRLKKRYVIIALGIAGAMAVSYTLPTAHLRGRDRVLYTNSTLGFIFVAMAAYLYVKVKNKLEISKRRSLYTFLLSLTFSTMLLIGARLESLDNFEVTRIGNYFVILLSAVFFHPFLEISWKYLDEKREQNKIRKEDKIPSLVKNWLIIFLCWLPVFLAFYPGAFVYDAWDEFEQVRTGEYTTHHPLLHVLLLGKTVFAGEEIFGSYNTGIAVYTIAQMIIMSAAVSYCLDYIGSKITSKILEVGILCFYCFFPLFPMYAVCSAKDSLFTTFLLLSVVMLLKLGENKRVFFKKKRNIFFLSLSLILMMMFRNNGSYAYVAWLLVPMAIGVISTKKKNSEKKYYRSLLLLLILPLGLSMIFSYGLEKGLKAKKGGSQEIMTVPIQQMARVYKYAPETYSEKEKEILYEILPKEELHLYTPRISDLLKSKFNSQAFRQHPLKYIGLWSKIGMRKPLIYLNGWLLTSYGYWYPDAVINVYGGNPRHTIVYEDSSYFGFETEPPGIRESKFPLLEKIYRKISLELFQQKIPAVSLFFSPGFTFWVYLWGVTYLWYQKRWEVFIPFLLILFVWLTVILGPTYLVRYVLVLWFALPLLISVLKAGEKDESKD